MRTLLMEHRAEGAALALLNDRVLTDYREVPEYSLRAEAILVGRVRQNAKGMAAAFVSLPGDQVGFLPEAEARQPLHPGDFVLVQIKKPAVSTKGAYLTQDISLAGRGLVLLPLNGTVGVSSRVEDEAQREQLKALGAKIKPGSMGLIMRQAAAEMDESALRGELEKLAERWRDLENGAKDVRSLRLLWPGRSALEQALEDFGHIDRLILDQEETGAPAHEISARPFAAFGVAEQLERLRRRQVWLPSGGFVIVDPCEALTAIDVNTGKSVGKGGDKEQLFLRTNLEAADMIARILRVRGIGGIVIVDLIDMETDAARETVLERFRTLLREDPVKCVVHGFTSLGLLELTRKKR
ncbi:MAG: ribonuclease E/G [Clostridia bacterium]|nr:ribonuclease E/G [Clostridia bacterium]